MSGDDGRDFWHPAGECWACHVCTGRTSGSILVDDREILAVMNPFPINPGHTLIVPRQHIRNLYELPDHLGGPMLALAARVARAAKLAFSADGITLRQNNEPASDQHLFHFHLHVVPRFEADAARFASPPQRASEAEQEAEAVRLRTALARQE